jgi:penicillin-binding protein 2
MSEPAIFFSEVNERQSTFHRRAFFMGGLVGVGMTALGVRLAELQVFENDRYKMLSASNQYNFRLVLPPRGRILDRNGVELASNRPNFRLLLLKDEAPNIEETLAEVSKLIAITPERYRQIRRDLAEGPRFVPVSVADDLSWEEFARINIRSPELPGVQADMGEARVYPFGGAFSHVIGYVSKVNDAEVKKAGPTPDPVMLNPGFRIGKQGVEKALDMDLRGKPGGQKVEVDSRGRVVREDPLGDIKPTPGKEVVLSLDADIQNRALEVFGEDSGAAVMMDCRTGDVLCLYSAPSFDANRFAKGLTNTEYQALAEYDRKPLFNKALTANYPPGSTFKTMVALAALENQVDPHRTYYCSGAWAWGGRVWHCDQAHGVMDMHNAIATSCDIFFYQTALSVGPDKIAKVAREFGLGQTFDIGLSMRDQKPGIVPDTAYKRRAFPKDPTWHPGETPSMGIGQGYVSVNAMQLCVMVSRLANGIKALQPRLIRSIGGVALPSGAQAPDLTTQHEHLDFVRAAMAAVANDARGTGFAASQLGLGPVKMAGKTGTAQVHSYAGGHGAHGAVGAWELRDHAWFVAFAPYDDPRYAMSVLVEHGGFGAQAAAPKAREIMRVALLKDSEVRARIEQPLPMPAIPATPPGQRPEGAAPPPPTDLPSSAPGAAT